MRAVVIHRYGGPEVCAIEDRESPRPGPGEALIGVGRAGLNFIDVHLRLGRYANSQTYRNALPMVLGMEGGGVVLEVGADVAGIAPGMRVAWCAVRGSFADYAVVPATKLVAVPDDVDFDTATALMLQGLTAHYLATSAFPLSPGHTCLVHAAAGGVGGLLVQVAKHRGAAVIASVGSEAKADVARELGADHVVLYREQNFRAEVRRLTGGAGVDVVYDSVGKDTIADSIRSLKRRGTCINFGGASGLVESIVPLELGEAGSVFFTRPHLADYIATPGELAHRATELFALVRDGRLRTRIDRRFDLAGVVEAMRYLEAGKTRGKILLDVAP